MGSERPPDAFLSYTRFDDQHDGGAISQFRVRLANAVRTVTGQPFEIFQDVDGIGIGEYRPGKLDRMLDTVRFFIPILTPSYFTSKPCREELEKFLRAEAERGRNDLVLPIYYIECDVLEDADLRATNALAKIIHERQRQDWRGLRESSPKTKRVRTALSRVAKEIARRRNISALPLKTESDAVPMMLEGRAYADALERHGFECSLRHQEYEINEVETLLPRFRVEGLHVLTGAPPCEKLRFGVALSSHGEFLSEFFGLDEDSVRRGFRRETTPSCDGAPSKHGIVPPTPLLPGGPPATYGGGYACANSMMMTRWEALERTPQEHRRKGWDEEWVGVFVAYPARRFELVVRFPDSLATVNPELSCSRHPQYPDYPLDDCRHVESTAPDRLVPDRDVQREASRRLQQTEHNVWQLDLDRPQVGYFYQLRWRVPGGRHGGVAVPEADRRSSRPYSWFR